METQTATGLYPVKGMSCASCATSAENYLNKLPGIKQAKVNFASATAYIEYEELTVAPESIKKSLSEIGYELRLPEKGAAHSLSALLPDDSVSEYRLPALISMIFFVPLFVVGMFLMNESWSPYVMFGLTIPILFYGGRKFFVTAFRLLKRGQANMDSLVAVSTAVAFVFSTLNTFFPEIFAALNKVAHGHSLPYYYEAAGGVIAFVLLGKWLEDNAKAQTGAAVKSLVSLMPAKSTLVFDDGSTGEVDTSFIKPENVLMIKPGERIPVDGTVLKGNGRADESSLTGEFIPAEKNPGNKVFAGTLNENSVLHIKAVKVGDDTLQSGIVKSVYEALNSKAPIQRWADKVSAYFTPAMLVISVLTVIGWSIAEPEGGFLKGIFHACTVMVIACPCALGLATPTALSVAIGRAAKHGILIRNAASLEKAAEITDLCTDKTGTLTSGKPQVSEVKWLVPESNNLKTVLLSMEKTSDHPLSKAMVKYLESVGINEIILDSCEYLTGKGLKARFLNKNYFSGNARLLAEAGIEVPPTETDSRTGVWFASDNQVLAVIYLEDSLRPEAAKTLSKIKEAGISIHLLTGDTPAAGQSVGKTLDIKNIHAGLLPQEKSDYLKKLKSEGKTVAMLGDGINDAAALALADVGIAMGTGSDVAHQASAVTLTDNRLEKVISALTLSRQTVAVIRQNLFWAFIYNALSIPLAAGLTGWEFNPMWAGLAMAMSSFSVVMNSLRIRSFKI